MLISDGGRELSIGEIPPLVSGVSSSKIAPNDTYSTSGNQTYRCITDNNVSGGIRYGCGFQPPLRPGRAAFGDGGFELSRPMHWSVAHKDCKTTFSQDALHEGESPSGILPPN
jgi:hypothetical protein